MGTYLVTGASGTMGSALTRKLLADGHKVRAFARGEHRLAKLEESIPYEQRERLSCLLGDICDLDRLKRAMAGVDVVIHAAAQKVIPLAEYNPVECAKVNIFGTVNVTQAALDLEIPHAVFVSTDKASAPSTIYGACKLTSERIWLASNRYRGGLGGIFTAVRFGNVFGSAGSVIHVFMRDKNTKRLLVTDPKMTRFSMRIEEAVDWILFTLHHANPGELVIPKLPSFFVTELAKTVAPDAELKITGIRPGEKLAETLISANESQNAIEYESHYVLTPGKIQQNGGWEYSSATSTKNLGRFELQEEILHFIEKGPQLG